MTENRWALYSDYFKLNDDLIQHLDSVLNSLNDPFIESRYTGFLAVSSDTVLELGLKAIFMDFSKTQHPVFGTFCEAHFEKINGRIRYDQIIGEYLPRFGAHYLSTFKIEVDQLEAQVLAIQKTSVKEAYANLITWRNDFAHDGNVPANPTYAEVKAAYASGKEIMKCLHAAMV